MPTKQTLPLTCPCEKSHAFEETFLVEGPGLTPIQLPCPHPQCPAKDALLSFKLPFELHRPTGPLKGVELKPKA